MEMYREPRLSPRERVLFIERYFSLGKEFFEQNTGLQMASLERRAYSPPRHSFQPVFEMERKRGPEVLYDRESSTLIVPPPTSAGVASWSDVAEMAIPVVGFIEEKQPDIIIGCDRGARFYGLAVYRMWRKLQNGQRFPTLDFSTRFTRLSTSLEREITTEALRRIIANSFREAEIKGTHMHTPKLRILFIDDIIASGRTRTHIFQSLDQALKDNFHSDLSAIDVNFAIMCGQRADVTGKDRVVGWSWNDKPNVIGIDYKKDGTPIVKMKRKAIEGRRALYEACEMVAAAFVRE